jgi:hypothetical protein
VFGALGFLLAPQVRWWQHTAAQPFCLNIQAVALLNRVCSMAVPVLLDTSCWNLVFKQSVNQSVRRCGDSWCAAFSWLTRVQRHIVGLCTATFCLHPPPFIHSTHLS